MTDFEKKMHHDGRLYGWGNVDCNLRISVFCFSTFWNMAGF